jgi:hypothetical protein
MHALKIAIIRGFDQPAVIHLYELFGLMLAVILMLSVVGGRLAHRGRTH